MDFLRFSALPVLLFATSCSTDTGTSTYSVADLGRPQNTVYGVILSVREVFLESTDYVAPTIGTGLGAVAGALIGKTQNHTAAGAVLGGVAGGVGGHLLHKKRKQKGYEYQVQTDTGHCITMVQGPDVALAPGQRVAVVYPDAHDRRGRLLPI
jgi:outer membrane lipoprotein SlyB